MNTLLLRASLRYLLLHWGQTSLALLGVAVGVAAWVSVQSAARAAEDAFSLSTRQAFGSATHQVLPLDRTLDEYVFAELRRSVPMAPAAPVLLERIGVRVGDTQTSMQLIGIDPLAEAALRREGVAAAGVGPALTALIGDERSAVMAASLAAAWGLAEGDELTVIHAGREHRLRLLALAESEHLPLGEDTLLVDLAAAQRVLGAEGRLSRIDLLLQDTELAQVVARLPPQVELVATLARSEAIAAMTRAYRLNLLALSLLTLLVGLLLVYSTMTHLVAQRGELFERLRALGLGAAQVRRLVLTEALVLGLAGGVLGALAGTLLARGLVGLMAGNITDLYFRVQVQTLAPQPGVMLIGALLGLAAAVAGGAVPAMQAVSRAAAHTRSPTVELLLSLLLALVAALVLRYSQGRVAGFAGLFLAACAGALLVPVALHAITRLLAWLPGLRGRLLARMTLRESRAGLMRTRVALAGLVLAVATVIALDLMVANFRDSVATWLEDTVAGDLVVGLDSAIYPDARKGPLREIAARVRTLEQVEDVAGVRFMRLREGAEVLLLRAAEHPHGVPGIVDGAAGRDFERGEGVLVSEPLARRRDLAVGDALRLALPQGAVTLPVLGIYRDYLSDRGVVLMSLQGLARRTGEDTLTSFSVLTAAPERVRPQLEALLAGVPGVVLTDSAALRAQTLAIFDRTFTVTHVLKLLVAGAAMLGMLAALLAWMLDRRALRRALRALGLSWGELRRQLVLETGVLGLATAVVALPLGVVLGALLVFVINRRAFGWSMQFELLAWPLWQGALLAIGTALLAGVLASAMLSRERRRRPVMAARGAAPASAALSLLLLATLASSGCADSAGPAPEDAGTLDAARLLGGDPEDERYARVTGPREFEFPADHGEHPAYRNEWWYLTGTLRDAQGRAFGFQYTLFRFAMAPPQEGEPREGWRSRQVYMAHLAVTHVEEAAHRHAERVARPGAGVAGVIAAPFQAWLQDWRLASERGAFLPLRLDAQATDFGLELRFLSGRPMVLQGEAGYSRKGRARGNASHYYSYTRLPTRGLLRWDDQLFEVEGTAWMDREWGSSVLDPDVVGWDWLSLRLRDGRDLMLFQLRQQDGGVSEFSAGSRVNPAGEVRRFDRQGFGMQPLRHWRSPDTGREYPVDWQVSVPAEGLDLTIRAVVPNQEMRTSVRYWEGMVEALDASGEVLGEGFLEMTGY
jgi:putative ABC transport system permease protein